ncbi:unnamed protein product [Lampetra fluviatilis]
MASATASSSAAAVSAAEAERGAADGLDPRIKEELEKLNQASEEINELEVKLTATRAEYCRVLSESAKKLNVCATKLGSCVERARPYYEARRQAKEAQAEAQRAALRYERAVSMHAAAREMVCVAEQGLACRGGTLDPAWQEMLNHATIKVNDAEADRLHSEREHQSRALRSQNAERHLQQLASSLRRVVMKSRPYFTLKATLGTQLEENKSNVTSLEKKARDAKARYAAALRSLEKISEEMHKERQLRPQQQQKQPKQPERSVRDVLGAEGQAMPPLFRDGSEGGTTHSLAALNALRSDADLEFALSFHAAESELALPPDTWPEPDGDSLSLGSLRSFASDLQKCDSVDHLAGLADTLSLCGSDGGAGPRAGGEGRRGTATALSTEAQAAAAAGGSALWVRGSSKQHQRSISM